MKYKRGLYILFLLVTFSAFWWILNNNMIKGFQGINDYDTFKSMMSLGVGYWNQKQFIVFYMILYLIMVYLFSSNFEEQLLIRLSRKQFLKQQITRIVKITLCFQIMFAVIGLVFLLVFIKSSMFFDINFLIIYTIEFVQEFFYYFLFGNFFSFIYLLIHNKTKTFLITAVVSFLQYGILVWLGHYLWMPINTIKALDSYYAEGSISIIGLVFDFIKISILLLIIIKFSFQIIKKKDMIKCEE